MNRQLFTAADIRRLVHARKGDVLVLGAHDLLTPEAADVARDLGVRIVREAEGQVAPPTPALRKLPPLLGIRRAAVTLEAFGAEIPKTAEVRLRDVVTQGDGSPMAAGYMALDATQPGAAASFRGRSPTTRWISCWKGSWSSPAATSRCAAGRGM
jgi:hypothetical protein